MICSISKAWIWRDDQQRPARGVQVPGSGHPAAHNLRLEPLPSELHIFVRPEINSLQDLAGKKVNFNTLGTAAAYSGPLMLSRMRLDVEKLFIPHPVALEQMRRGEIAGVVFVTSKPVDAFVRGRWEGGYKFLPVDYDAKFEDYYIPSYLDSTDYPNLVSRGERISTIAVPTILSVQLDLRKDTGASRSSSTTSSRVSINCRHPASIPSGMTSI
jgi:TRAP-type uncharacterized transport system substrate-binding protein